MIQSRFFVVALMGFVLHGSVALAGSDWTNWRGPDQNGISTDRGLPDRWSPDGENLLWSKEEYATRSTPIVMNGRLYTMCRAFPESTQEGERVVCLDAATGALVWETFNNVYLSDAPAERVGWSSVVGDPETGHVYALGLGCLLQCLDGSTGKVLWSRSMSEEFGMLSTYGGRTNFPILFDDLLIISGVTTGWGETAMPAHRFFAFDKGTGTVVWLASTRPRPEDTTYCTPVITTFGGQAAMVAGAGDGSVYAFQPRTGQVIWKYDASNRGINTTPLVAGGMVYCGHSEQNTADTTILGALFAFDGRTGGEIAEQNLLWKIPAVTVGRCQPLVVDNRLYAIDDSATMWIVDARTGEGIGRQRLGRIMFGSMVYGDGKIYVGEATGRWYVLKPTETGVEVVHQLRLNNTEILGSPVIADGRIYLPTSEALYCIANKEAARPAVRPPVRRAASPAVADTKIAHLQIVPADALLESGGEIAFAVRAFNALGERLADAAVEYSVEGDGRVDASGRFSSSRSTAHAASLVTAKLGDVSSTARVRVVPPLPWRFDFADAQVPVTWIGANLRHQPRTVEGEAVLAKVSTIPKGTRSQLWMGPTHLHDYTIQADFYATEANGKSPDMGLINQRYTLAINSSQELQIRSWTSRLELRFARTVPFEWTTGRWYTARFQSENAEGKTILRGKVWPRGEREPDDWMIEAADATPNTVGSPGLFGNASDAEFYIDNVQVVENSQ